MRLTARCRDILRLLSVCQWLATRQLHRRYFAEASIKAARQRLLKLCRAGYVRRVQPSRMQDALFSLGPSGRRALELDGMELSKACPRNPPKQLEHLLGINDVRIAAELALDVSYFFACWELPALGWKQPIIPDAVFATGPKVFAVEFDRGQENVRFFVKTKLPYYARGLSGFPLYAIIIVAERQARMQSLMKAIGRTGLHMVFTTIDMIRGQGLAGPIFFETGHQSGVNLL